MRGARVHAEQKRARADVARVGRLARGCRAAPRVADARRKRPSRRDAAPDANMSPAGASIADGQRRSRSRAAPRRSRPSRGPLVAPRIAAAGPWSRRGCWAWSAPTLRAVRAAPSSAACRSSRAVARTPEHGQPSMAVRAASAAFGDKLDVAVRRNFTPSALLTPSGRLLHAAAAAVDNESRGAGVRGGAAEVAGAPGRRRSSRSRRRRRRRRPRAPTRRERRRPDARGTASRADETSPGAAAPADFLERGARWRLARVERAMGTGDRAVGEDGRRPSCRGQGVLLRRRPSSLTGAGVGMPGCSGAAHPGRTVLGLEVAEALTRRLRRPVPITVERPARRPSLATPTPAPSRARSSRSTTSPGLPGHGQAPLPPSYRGFRWRRRHLLIAGDLSRSRARELLGVLGRGHRVHDPRLPGAPRTSSAF